MSCLTHACIVKSFTREFHIMEIIQLSIHQHHWNQGHQGQTLAEQRIHDFDSESLRLSPAFLVLRYPRRYQRMQPGSRKRSLSDDQRLAKLWLPGPEQEHWGSHLNPVAARSLLPVIRPQRLDYRHLRIAIMVLVDASEKRNQVSSYLEWCLDLVFLSRHCIDTCVYKQD